MLVVDHCVRPSTIHGLGVFIMEAVAAGTVVWRYDPTFDIEISANTVAGFPKDVAEVVYHHAEYLPEHEIFRLGNDADIFMNHSSGPSLIDLGDEMIASQDLVVGDELTCDYRKVCVVGFTACVKASCAHP
ncbi:SET domain-containing protein-lysine N-methyltransferase [Roseovarius sp. D22-M7]|uniref:SET domain-containing protein-lysine N-methyltransferase n=1 Tax=Roseovarius sp. D22-M7 TaxID=3127116 RepID=UPI00300FE9B9